MRVKVKIAIRSLFGQRGETEIEAEADTFEEVKKLLELVDETELKVG